MPPLKKKTATGPHKVVRTLTIVGKLKKGKAASAVPKAKKRSPTVKSRKKYPAIKKIVVPTINLEEKVEESKYDIGSVGQTFPESPLAAAKETRFEFPSGYGDNHIVLMVRDPHWLYTYWEINEKRRGEIIGEIGKDIFERSSEMLRVHDTNSWESFDLSLSYGARNWYVHVPNPGRTYCVEIGYKTPDGRFIAAAHSNWVKTPLDRMSDEIDEEWMIPDWEKIYSLSGGFGIGKGSEEIRELMQKRFEAESASGWVSSISSPVRKLGERPFWLVANCELIVYGATEPTATVTVQGHKIKLREDGTFSLRYALPDGKQFIPVEAVRDDGEQRRKIIPIVERKTE